MILSRENASTCSPLNQRLLPKLLLGHSDPLAPLGISEKPVAKGREMNASHVRLVTFVYRIGCKNKRPRRSKIRRNSHATSQTDSLLPLWRVARLRRQE